MTEPTETSSDSATDASPGPAVNMIPDLQHEIDLPTPVAVWVLFAHLFTILFPMTIIWAVTTHWDYLQANDEVYSPVFYLVGASVLMIGSAFEIAQNTFDRWYLTEETASAMGRSLCDMLFYWCVTMGLATIAFASKGDFILIKLLWLGALVLLPLLYVRGKPFTPVMAVVGFSNSLCLFLCFGEPAVFLSSILGAGYTTYFFGVLLRTGSQTMHGFTTSVNALGTAMIPLAIFHGANGTQWHWGVAVAIGIGAVLSMVLMRKPLDKLGSTPRLSPQPQDAP